VGVQAQGRTTILKINYRNTRQILQTASLIAADLLTADEQDDDGIPLLKPISCGRDGEAPLIIRLPTLRDEAVRIAELLNAAHQEGHAWGDMAVICRHYSVMDECASALARRKLPYQVRKAPGSFKPNANTIKVLTMHASKGLEYAVVALPGVGQMPAPGDDEQEEARLFYVAATRATQRLVITASGDGRFGRRLG
jgi:superfamily I DNA/RNA helicase